MQGFTKRTLTVSSTNMKSSEGQHEELPKLEVFIGEFEYKGSEPQRLLELDKELKATPIR